MIEFTVSDWAAWAPGMQNQDAWRAWAQAPYLPHGEQTPELPEVPAMQRRRIERLGRMAMQAAWWCGQPDDGVPLVFASRHGDVQRSCELLRQLASAEPMSPTHFGLSVHNAIAALHSIVRGERGNYLALAAGAATAETALVEAAGLLADGAREVQVVLYDVPLPAAYATFVDEPEACYAWSWRVRHGGAGTPIRLTWAAEDAQAVVTPTAATTLPAGLAALQFLLSQQSRREHCADGLHWCWQRVG